MEQRVTAKRELPRNQKQVSLENHEEAARWMRQNLILQEGFED